MTTLTIVVVVLLVAAPFIARRRQELDWSGLYSAWVWFVVSLFVIAPFAWSRASAVSHFRRSGELNAVDLIVVEPLEIAIRVILLGIALLKLAKVLTEAPTAAEATNARLSVPPSLT